MPRDISAWPSATHNPLAAPEADILPSGRASSDARPASSGIVATVQLDAPTVSSGIVATVLPDAPTASSGAVATVLLDVPRRRDANCCAARAAPSE